MNKWNNSTVETYKKHFGLASNPIIYEVGSRDGNDGVELAQRIYSGSNLWQDSTIVLFECNPPQIEAIKQAYPKAVLITEAISNKKGTVDFMQIHGDKNMMGSSTLNTKRNDRWIKNTSTIKVNTRRLDDVIKALQHETTDIDIMKIDIEGYTYEALESMGQYLRNVKVFHLETEIEGSAQNKTNLDIALFMQERGYLCVAIEEEWGPLILDQVWYRQ
jgi:FkbM family methyltransferase